jgi:hypothetical protein
MEINGMAHVIDTTPAIIASAGAPRFGIGAPTSTISTPS